MTTLEIGDQVRIKDGAFRSNHVGELVAISDSGVFTHTVMFDDEAFADSFDHTYKANELELIDASAEMVGSDRADESVSAGVAGSADDDVSGAGSEAEPAAEEPSMATATDDPPQGKALTRVLDRLGERLEKTERLLEVQNQINLELAETLSLLMSGTAARSTTRRMRVNIKQLASGKYQPDTTYEITTTDPEVNLSLLMTMGLAESDRVARDAIACREYTDEHGPPGAEDDRPF